MLFLLCRQDSHEEGFVLLQVGSYPVTLAETSLAPWVTVLGPSLATAEIKTLWVYLTGAEPNLHGVVLYWSTLKDECLHGLGDGAETGWVYSSA